MLMDRFDFKFILFIKPLKDLKAAVNQFAINALDGCECSAWVWRVREL